MSETFKNENVELLPARTTMHGFRLSVHAKNIAVVFNFAAGNYGPVDQENYVWISQS